MARCSMVDLVKSSVRYGFLTPRKYTRRRLLGAEMEDRPREVLLHPSDDGRHAVRLVVRHAAARALSEFIDSRTFIHFVYQIPS